MDCPFCNTPDTKVIDSRLAAEGRQIRRRRECMQCGERFTTFEVIELVMPRVIKSNKRIEPFDEQKLRRSLALALQKRPVNSEQQDIAIAQIQQKLRAMGEREVAARVIGELVMQTLKDLDSVAYVRFASVYRNFQDVEAFKNALDNLHDSPLSDTELHHHINNQNNGHPQ